MTHDRFLSTDNDDRFLSIVCATGFTIMSIKYALLVRL